MKVIKLANILFLTLVLSLGLTPITRGMVDCKYPKSKLTPISEETADGKVTSKLITLTQSSKRNIDPNAIFNYGNDLFRTSEVNSNNFYQGLIFMIDSSLLIVSASIDAIPDEIKKENPIIYHGCKFYQPKSNLHYVLVPNVDTWNKLKAFLLSKTK